MFTTEKFVDGRRVDHRVHAFHADTLVAEQLEHADVLRFGRQGPQPYLIPLGDFETRLTPDGARVAVTHMMPLVLNPDVPEGTTADGLKRKIIKVLRDSRGWIQTGIWPQFVEDPAKFDTATQKGRYCTINVLPPGDTTCGGQWTSCAHWKWWVNGNTHTYQIWVDLKLVHMDGVFPEGAMGPNHEVYGHIFLGACDMYRFENAPGFVSSYGGNMDAGADGTPWPTPADIAEGKAKQEGRARYPACGYPAT